ncbi:MAG: aquaporin [Planctomycetes bacterium]|nr:aquaporin [Planctomycetota bacterium]
MLTALRKHWPEYLMEAFGLFAFMIGAGTFTTLFDYPGSPVHQAIPSEFLRRVLLGLLMGLVTAGIIYSPWGKRSGAHINPAVTIAFYRLGKIAPWDAAFYVIFQFAGAILAPIVLLLVLGGPFAHAKVHYAATVPGPEGVYVAFVAEFIITFVLMLVALCAINTKKLEHWTGACIAALIALYIAIEAPFSGMSMNPARSVGSAVTAHMWMGMWLYLIAPTLAALLATEIYMRVRRSEVTGCVKLYHDHSARCIFCDYHEGPRYPVPTANT